MPGRSRSRSRLSRLRGRQVSERVLEEGEPRGVCGTVQRRRESSSGAQASEAGRSGRCCLTVIPLEASGCTRRANEIRGELTDWVQFGRNLNHFQQVPRSPNNGYVCQADVSERLHHLIGLERAPLTGRKAPMRLERTFPRPESDRPRNTYEKILDPVRPPRSSAQLSDRFGKRDEAYEKMRLSCWTRKRQSQGLASGSYPGQEPA